MRQALKIWDRHSVEFVPFVCLFLAAAIQLAVTLLDLFSAQEGIAFEGSVLAPSVLPTATGTVLSVKTTPAGLRAVSVVGLVLNAAYMIYLLLLLIIAG